MAQPQPTRQSPSRIEPGSRFCQPKALPASSKHFIRERLVKGSPLIGSFIVSQTNLLWAPGIPVGLVVLAFAQIGVHLVFFLHLGSGPDNTNNILALAFGLLIVFLVITGSCWIMANLNANMMPM